MIKLSNTFAASLLFVAYFYSMINTRNALGQSDTTTIDTSKIHVRRVPLQIGDGMAFAPFISDDGLRIFFVYKNKSKGSLIGKDLFCMSERSAISDTSWGVPKILQLVDNVNHVGAVTFDAKNNAYISYQSETADRGDVDILFISMSEDGTFTQQPRMEINTKRWESQPSVSRDGSLLFFASNRGTMSNGDKLNDIDIFVSIKDTSGIFGDPINLGKNINRSSYDATPFIASDNKTLYYVSQLSEKKTAIFMSTHIGPTWTDWSKPVPLPSEFALAGNLLFPFIPMKGDKVYFSSDHSGKLEIYEATIPIPHEYFPTLKK